MNIPTVETLWAHVMQDTKCTCNALNKTWHTVSAVGTNKYQLDARNTAKYQEIPWNGTNIRFTTCTQVLLISFDYLTINNTISGFGLFVVETRACTHVHALGLAQAWRGQISSQSPNLPNLSLYPSDGLGKVPAPKERSPCPEMIVDLCPLNQM